MSQIRLTGLVLMMTVGLLAMVAAATGTSHIQLSSRPIERGSPENLENSANAVKTQEQAPPVDSQSGQVPIVWPLGGCGMFGLLLWFGPAWGTGGSKRKRARRRRRRKR